MLLYRNVIDFLILIPSIATSMNPSIDLNYFSRFSRFVYVENHTSTNNSHDVSLLLFIIHLFTLNTVKLKISSGDHDHSVLLLTLNRMCQMLHHYI